MFRSAKQFPQFAGKSSKYVNACLRFVLRKEPKLGLSFSAAVTAAILFSVILGVLPTNGWVGLILVIGGFYAYLLYAINKQFYPAVERHIEEFEKEYTDDDSIAP